MVLKFVPNERAFAPDLNNAALQFTFAVNSGCSVDQTVVPSMSVDVSGGNMLFNGITVTVASQTVALAPADPSFDRIDVIVLNAAGIASVLTGVPATVPKTQSYDATTYLAVARILVQDNVTSIVTADITDIRVINPILSTGGLAKYSTSFTGTNITVVHNLNDGLPVVQVYNSSNELITPDVVDIIDSNTVNIQFSSSTTGYVIIQGGTFTPSILTSSLVSQGFINQTTVNFNHGLGLSNPFVQVYDNTNQVIEPVSITAVDADNITVVFGSSTSGTVVATGSAVTPAAGVGKATSTFTSALTHTFTHNLNDTTPTVCVYDSTGKQIFPDVTVLNNNNIKLDFAIAETGSVVVVAGVFVGGTNSGNFLPSSDNTFDIGSGSYRWKDAYFAGKINVAGGVDPTYMQFTPQAGSSGIPNTAIYVDSSDNNTLKFKNNSGNVEPVNGGELGEVKMFAVTLTGAVTIATLRTRGWAVCDGTSPAAQGITGATITSTPNLVGKFIRGNATASGAIGGSDTHNHQWAETGGNDQVIATSTASQSAHTSMSWDSNGTTLIDFAEYLSSSVLRNDYWTKNTTIVPPYYELVYCIRVK